MRIVANWGMTVLLAASALTGCAQSPATIRGQSPGVMAADSSAACPPYASGPIVGTAPGYGEQNHPMKRQMTHQDFRPYRGIRDNNFGYEGGYYAGPQGYYTDRSHIYAMAGSGSCAPSGCPACEYGRSCPTGGCPHCGFGPGGACGPGGCGPGGCPQNYQTYEFNWPRNMVFAPDVLPAGVVQYPYYTLRGPSDFFMK